MPGCETVPGWSAERCCPFCHRRGDLRTMMLVRAGRVRVCCRAVEFVERERPDAVAARALRR